MTKTLICPKCGETINMRDIMKQIGKMGADTNKKKGKKYFSDLAKKRWAKEGKYNPKEPTK